MNFPGNFPGNFFHWHKKAHRFSNDAPCYKKLFDSHFGRVEQVRAAVVIALYIPVFGIDTGQNTFRIAAVKLEMEHRTAVIVVSGEVSDHLAFFDGGTIFDCRGDLSVPQDGSVCIFDSDGTGSRIESRTGSCDSSIGHCVHWRTGSVFYIEVDTCMLSAITAGVAKGTSAGNRQVGCPDRADPVVFDVLPQLCKIICSTGIRAGFIVFIFYRCGCKCRAGFAAGTAVRGPVLVRLERLYGRPGRWTENSIGFSGIITQVIQLLLNIGHILFDFCQGLLPGNSVNRQPVVGLVPDDG